MPCYYVKTFEQNYYAFKRNPNLAGNALFEVEDDWQAHSHTHQDTELLFIMEGNGQIVIDSENHWIEKGDIAIVNPGVRHYEDYHRLKASDAPLRFFCCELFDFETGILPANHLLPIGYSPVQRTGEYEPTFLRLFTQLFEQHISGAPWYAHICNSISNEIAILIMRLLNDRYGTFHPCSYKNSAELIQSYIDLHFCENIDVLSIANALHMSRHTMLRIFRSEVGISPSQYLKHRRLEYAKRAILNKEHSLQQIANDVGYPNYSSFNAFFHREVGCAPKDYHHIHKKPLHTNSPHKGPGI